jgi:hypothetical protein
MERRVRLRLRVCSSVSVLIVAAACSSAAGTQGPSLQICDGTIAQAMNPSGETTWYMDATTQKGATLKLPYLASDPTVAGTWLRLSTSCSVGESIAISDPTVIKVSDRIRATDGKDAAVRISPVGLGTATVTIGATGTTTRFDVVQQP